MRASSTRYVVCWALVVVVCAGVGDGQSIADEGPTTPGACTFNAKIIDPPDIIAELLFFPNLKSLIGSRFSGNATVVTLELSFPCRAILPTHCCKVFVLSAPTWSNALQSIRPKYILDGGAGAGYATLLLASLFPSARIISVEANAADYALLRRNTAALNNVHPVRAMLWCGQYPRCSMSATPTRNRHKQTMLQPTSDDGDRSFAFQELPHGEPTVGPHQFFRHLSYAAPIPHLMRLFGFPSIDLVKLDLEGAEARVLARNAPLQWLKDARAVLVQLHDRAAAAMGVSEVSGPVVDLMRSRGFTVSHTGEFTLFAREERKPQAARKEAAESTIDGSLS